MNTCPFCGKNIDIDYINHTLADIKVYTAHSGKITDWKEFWECKVHGKRFEGKLSEQASEEAKKDRDHRAKLFISYFKIMKNIEDSEAYKERGESYFELEQYDLALDNFNQAINYNSKDADSYYLRGKSNECLGKPDLAIKDFRAAARLGNKEAQDCLKKKE